MIKIKWYCLLIRPVHKIEINGVFCILMSCRFTPDVHENEEYRYICPQTTENL